MGMAISCKNVLTLRATHVLTFGVFFYEKQVNTGVMYGSATVMAPVKNCANTSPAVKSKPMARIFTKIQIRGLCSVRE